MTRAARQPAAMEIAAEKLCEHIAPPLRRALKSSSLAPHGTGRRRGCRWCRSAGELLAPERARVFDYHFGVEKDGNAPEDPQGEFKNKNILIQRHDVAETAKKFGLTTEKAGQALAESRKLLFAARASRPRPHLDDKIVTAWNGLMISAFARAAQVLDDSTYFEAANKAADFLQQKLYRADTNTLSRSYRQGASEVNGFASDYAFLAQGLLDLYETSFDIGRIEWAMKLQKREDELFHDPKGGGYFTTSGTDANVLLRMKEADDSAEPSPNSSLR